MAHTALVTARAVEVLREEIDELRARADVFARRARTDGVVDGVLFGTWGDLGDENMTRLEAGTIPALSAIVYYRLPG